LSTSAATTIAFSSPGDHGRLEELCIQRQRGDHNIFSFRAVSEDAPPAGLAPAFRRDHARNLARRSQHRRDAIRALGNDR
jgi:hypothetical protein